MIQVHSDATEDLKAIRQVNPEDFFKLVALIQQLQSDTRLIGKLLDHGFGDDKSEPISVKKWYSFQRIEHLPIWRLRAWNLEQQGLKYRLLYFYYWPNKKYYIMAIVHRDKFDYDSTNEPIRKRITQRIRAEFPNA